MSEAESLGENRNSFVLPLTKMRRKFIISAGTLLDILPFDIHPDVHRGGKNYNKQTEKSRSLQATEINLNDLDGFVVCFPKIKLFRSPSAGLAEVASEEEQSPGTGWPEPEGTPGTAAAAPVVVVVVVVSSSSSRTGRAR